MIADQDLIDAFNGTAPGRTFRATFIPEEAPYPSVELWEYAFFKAPNKPQAVKIAREYGKRIIGKKMIFVYLASYSDLSRLRDYAWPQAN